jgi:glycosyltransferase involved in cell wall biosynthesis
MDFNVAPPLISIAVCTFNGERYLTAQLESLVAQTWGNLEIVVVDDCSNDGTLGIIEEFAGRDSRIKLHKNNQNLGVNKNFSRAMALCKGELIAPCDQDDIWHPQKLSRLHAHVGEHAMSYCDSELITADGVRMNMRISDRIHMYQGDDPTVFAFWNCVSGHAMLFRRSLLDFALPIPDIKFHDWWLAFLATTNGAIVYLNEPLVQYRQHANAQTDLSRINKKKDAGNRTSLFKERAQWLAHLASVQSPQTSYFVELHRLWLAQAEQWFSIELVKHIAKRSESLLFINKNRSFLRFAFKNFWGMKAKVLVNPSNYSKV